MKKTELKKIRDEADKVETMTADYGRTLPNMLGVMVGAGLKYHGFKTIVHDGVKTFYQTFEMDEFISNS